MDTHFDVLILGTGLVNSIVAAALSKAGLKVAHIDTNSYYGGNEASLSQEEVIDWAKHQTQKFSVFSDITISRSTPIPFARSFSLSLSPSLIPSTGPLIRALVNSGVSRYGQFKLLDAVLICKAKPGIDVVTLTSLSNDSSSLHTHPKVSESSEAVSSSNMHETFFTSFSASQFLRRVPATKEDIFRTRSIPLISKRKLMRFLQFAASEFEMKPELQGLSEVQLSFGEFLKTKFGLDDEMTDAILFALAFCVKPDDPTVPALIRLREYIRSAGRYGNSPFLVGHYGGLGELAQGFCRTCAVSGGIYILGRPIISLSLPNLNSETPKPASIELEDVPDILTADVVLMEEDYLAYLPEQKPVTQDDQGQKTAFAILILNAPVDFPKSEAVKSAEGGSNEESEVHGQVHQDEKPRTAVVVFPPLKEESHPYAVHMMVMGDETLSCPRGKYILHASTPLLSSSSSSPEELLQPFISTIIPSSHIDFSCFYARLSPSSLSHPPLNSRIFITPSLPLSLPEIADISAKEAERMFTLMLKAAGKEGDAGEGMWPEMEQDGDDDEW